MPKFSVTVIQERIFEVVVEADSKEAATDKVDNMDHDEVTSDKNYNSSEWYTADAEEIEDE